MTEILETTLPAELLGRDVLAVPSTNDILRLAAMRYPDVRWRVDSKEAASQSKNRKGSGGARFRGMQSAAAPINPELELEPGITLTGPFKCAARDSQALGFLAVEHDLYVLGEPESEDALSNLQTWAILAAKHSWGAVLDQTGEVSRPDPEEGIGLHLLSPDPQPLEVVLEYVRSALPSAQLVAEFGDGSAIAATLEYDGVVVVQVSRMNREVPVALKSVDWRSYGPHHYSVQWMPPAELSSGEPASLYVIARQRASVVIARAMRALQQSLTGTVLDGDDVVVQKEQLIQRALGRRGF